jgi:Ca-activated chloride channel family protein
MNLILAHPWCLALLPLPLLVWFLVPSRRDSRQGLVVPFLGRLAEHSGQQPAKGAVVARGGWLRRLSLLVSWLCVIAALARPQVIEAPETKEVPVRDLLLAVDLSGSMETKDFKNAQGQTVDRLTAVKEVLDDFLQHRQGDRVGLIFFGTAPFVQAPFTEDLKVCRQLLDEAQVRMAGPQTAFGDALGLAINVFERSPMKDRVLIALTDGNDTASQVPPAKAAEIARDKGIAIHTAGGRRGRPRCRRAESRRHHHRRDVRPGHRPAATGGNLPKARPAGDPQGADHHAPSAARCLLVVPGRGRTGVDAAARGAVASDSPGSKCRAGACRRAIFRSRHVDKRQPYKRPSCMIADFHFLRPWLLLALVPAVLLWWGLRRRDDARQMWKGIIAAHLLPHLLSGEERRARFGPLELIAVGWLVAVLALAGPTWRRAPSPFADNTAALAIVVKVSPSMITEDVQPTRLARATQKIHDLLAQRAGTKTSLIAYAGTAHVVMPATTDGGIIDTFARALDPKIMPAEGDAAAAALRLADESLRAAGSGSILWITDSIAPEQADALAAWRKNSRTPVRLLPPLFPGAELDALEQAARVTDVSVVALAADDSDVRTLAHDAKFSTAALGGTGDRWEDRGYWLTPLLVLLLLPFFRRGWMVRTAATS